MSSGSHRIFVVEDDPDLVRLLETVLKPLGEVKTVTNGMDAVETIRKGYVPDVIILDWMMPGLDGMRTCLLIKKRAATAHVPIIMLTAKDTVDDVIIGINIGARHYMTKPFKTAELLEKVRSALGYEVD